MHLSPGERCELGSVRIECAPPTGQLELLSVRRITMPARAADLLPLTAPLKLSPGVHHVDLGGAEAKPGDLLIFEFDAGSESTNSGSLNVEINARPTAGQQVLL